MVEQMKYMSITGPVDNMSNVIEQYLSRYDIQLEYAAKQLKYTDGLRPFTGVNPYVEALHKAERFLTYYRNVPAVSYLISSERALQLVEDVNQNYEKRDIAQKELEYKRNAVVRYIDIIKDFTSLNIDIRQLESFRHISVCFGRLPVGNFRQFEKFLYDDSEIIFLQSNSDNEYIWGVYFTPATTRDKVNSIFSALHFERIPVSCVLLGESLAGTPSELIHMAQERLVELEAGINTITDNNLNEIGVNKGELVAACERIKALYNAFDLRKYAAVTQKDNYVFVGWMSRKDALKLEQEIDRDDMTFFSRTGEVGEHTYGDNPPTHLMNPPVIRLFEFFTRMYGIPAYGEMDPTPIMAVTYTLLFGLMFGDVGQGLCVAALGYFAYKRFKTDLGGIMVVIGLSGTVFGFLYGSVFGLEDLLPALWRRPAEDINGTLFFAVGIGVSLIFLSMLLHIINAVRQKHWGELFFSPNGIAGMMFYGMILFVALRVLLYGHAVSGLDIALVCLPLVFVAFREPISKYIEGERKIIEGGIGMFMFSTILEMVEVLLSYATNTISFVRVGAFAISHAGMMSVVLMLSRSAAGTHNPVIMALGNILVMVIEGLLVGIQVLRLDFYELFSRFYNGGGQEFTTNRVNNKA